MAIMSNTVNLLALGMLLVDRGVFTTETGGSPVSTGVHTVPGSRETCVPRRGTKDGGFSFTR